MSQLTVALINPPNVRKMGRPEESASPPLGLAYIGAVLREAGFRTDLFDLADELDIQETQLTETDFFSYDVYGFTSYTKTFSAALQLIRLVRQIRPQAIVVIGGPHATPAAKRLLEAHAEIDVVVRNEGEMPMLELLRHLSTGSPELSSIGNLVYRDYGLDVRRYSYPLPASYGVVQNVDYQNLPPVDSLPFPLREYKIEPSRVAYETRNHELPVRTEFLSSSRGCPKRCTFCSIIVMSPVYRFRSVESIMQEIRELHAKEQFGHISFLDANFLVNATRGVEFARALHAWNPSVTWSATATADAIAKHPGAIEEIGRLNCVALEVGIENGSQSALSRYNKRTTIEQNLAAIELLEQAGIHLELDYILFDRETTLDELKENVEFLRSADLVDYFPTDHLYNAMRLYPGTPARTRYLELSGEDDGQIDDDLIPPFIDARVQRVYSAMIRFGRKFQNTAIDPLAASIDETCRELVHAPAADPAMMALLQRAFRVLIYLRHAPVYFLEELIEHVSLDNEGTDLRDSEFARMRSVTRLEQEIRSAERIQLELAKSSTDCNTTNVPYLPDWPVTMPRLTGNSRSLVVGEHDTIYVIPPLSLPVRLNPKASFLWRQFAERRKTDAIVVAYCTRFRCSAADAQSVIASFVESVAAEFLDCQDFSGAEVFLCAPSLTSYDP